MREIKQAIFIVGCGRSGTTMLGAMLGSHSRAITTPESQFNTDIYNIMERFNPQRAIEILENHHRFKIWNLNISPFRDTLLSSNSHKEFIFKTVSIYRDTIARKDSADIWIDHTPANVNKIDILLNIYPNAKIIHIIRDGRAVALSHKKVKWGKDYMPDMARFWISRVASGLAAECRYPDSVISIKYEDIVTDTENSLKRISNFIGIEYEDSMIEANGFILPEYTKEQHKLVGKRADSSRVNRWREELTQREIEIFEHYAKDILRILGYTPIYKNPKRERRIDRIRYRYSKVLKKMGIR